MEAGEVVFAQDEVSTAKRFSAKDTLRPLSIRGIKAKLTERPFSAPPPAPVLFLPRVRNIERVIGRAAAGAKALGRRALAQHSRDPVNPDGYMAHLRSQGAVGPVGESYIGEALNTFNAACFKATAMMVGAAAFGIAR